MNIWVVSRSIQTNILFSINSLSTSRCRQSTTHWLSLVLLSISSGCRCGVDPHRIVDRCGDCRSNRRSPSIGDRRSNHRSLWRRSTSNRRCCRCSSDIDRSSRAQGCRCDVNCRSSKLPLWRRSTSNVASLWCRSTSNRGDRRSNRQSSIAVNRRSSIESSVVVASIDIESSMLPLQL